MKSLADRGIYPDILRVRYDGARARYEELQLPMLSLAGVNALIDWLGHPDRLSRKIDWQGALLVAEMIQECGYLNRDPDRDGLIASAKRLYADMSGLRIDFIESNFPANIVVHAPQTRKKLPIYRVIYNGE